MVEITYDLLGKKYKVFQDYSIIEMGSVSEGTKIGIPDEFDSHGLSCYYPHLVHYLKYPPQLNVSFQHEDQRSCQTCFEIHPGQYFVLRYSLSMVKMAKAAVNILDFFHNVKRHYSYISQNSCTYYAIRQHPN
jgi:hypothetical protein